MSSATQLAYAAALQGPSLANLTLKQLKQRLASKKTVLAAKTDPVERAAARAEVDWVVEHIGLHELAVVTHAVADLDPAPTLGRGIGGDRYAAFDTPALAYQQVAVFARATSSAVRFTIFSNGPYGQLWEGPKTKAPAALRAVLTGAPIP
jgi:hypothetical protein